MKLIDQARALLQGEPLRAIVYGAAVVVWIASAALHYFNIANVQSVDMTEALAAATAAAALLTELSRRYVSPAA